MTETKINSAILDKFSKTVINRVKSDIPDITGKTIDGLYVERKMDVASGEAAIYICHREGETDDDSRLVLKLFHREEALKSDVLDRIRSIRNPCVAPVVHAGYFQGHRFTVLPYYRYPSLADVLLSGQTFSEKELRELIIPSVNEGLRAVHEQGVLHKDLKPSNLMLDNSGEHVVLIDFGISTAAGSKTLVVTQTGMTPFYAAPEALQGVYHRETDYYSFGITIFELFTGHTPFQMKDVTVDEAVRLSAVRGIDFPKDFPVNLKKLVLGLTYRDLTYRNDRNNPNRRWGYDEVKRWLAGEDLPVPGNNGGAVVSGFLPYSFSGRTFTEESELLIALLHAPEKGLKELGRGLLTHHYGFFDSVRAKLCHEAETSLGRYPEENLKTYVCLIYRLFAGRTKRIYFGGRSFDTLGAFADFVFERTLPVLPGLQMPAMVQQAEYWMRGNIMGWFAGNILKDSALEMNLNAAHDFMVRKNLSGIYRIFACVAMLSENCRKIVCRGQAFDTPADFAQALNERALSEDDGDYFVSEALNILNNGYLETFMLLVYADDPENGDNENTSENSENASMADIIRYVKNVFGRSDFADAPMKWQAFCLACCLSGDLKFDIRKTSFTSLSDFENSCKELEASNYDEFVSFMVSAKKEISYLKAFVRDPEYQKFLDHCIASTAAASFGKDYQFRNATDFLTRIDNLAAHKNYAEIRRIHDKYHAALMELDAVVWKSGVLEHLQEHLDKAPPGLLAGIKALCGFPVWNTGEISVSSGRKFTPARRRKYLGSEPVKEEYIRMGTWQTEADGPRSPLEWLVLEVEHDSALLLSRFCLKTIKFHEEGGNVMWDDCSLRTWLNTVFLNEAFSQMERDRLFQPEDSGDMVFCLSEKELGLIPKVRLKRDDPRYSRLFFTRCLAAPRVRKDEDPFIGTNGFSPWWLRDKGRKPGQRRLVWTDGTVTVGKADDAGNTVRPAIRIRM